MTQRHFEALADALAFSRPIDDPFGPSAATLQWRSDVRAVADVCASHNPRFDRDKFVQACRERFPA